MFLSLSVDFVFSFGRPDVTFVVDWAQRTNYLYIYLSSLSIQTPVVQSQCGHLHENLFTPAFFPSTRVFVVSFIGPPISMDKMASHPFQLSVSFHPRRQKMLEQDWGTHDTRQGVRWPFAVVITVVGHRPSCRRFKNDLA